MKFLLLFILSTTYIFGAPAYSKLREFKQADGTSFMAKAQGNQHLNWIETQDKKILKYNTQTKNYEYAQIKNSALKASGRKFKKNKTRKSSSLKTPQGLTKESVYNLWTKKRQEARKRRASKN